MRDDTRINIQCKEGQEKVILLTGNDLIELKDQTKSNFIALDIPSFLNYLSLSFKEESSQDDKPFAIYCSRYKINAVPAEIMHGTDSIAEVHLEMSDHLHRIRDRNGKSISPKSFEVFLKSMRAYYDKAGRDLEIRNDNLEINDCVQAKRIKGHDGSVEIMVSRKGNESDRLIIPEKVTFEVPMYKNHPETVKIVMEVTFSYEVVDGSFVANWRLDCWNIDDVLEEAFRDIIDLYFEGYTWPRYWGVLSVTDATDEWRYKRNPMTNG